MQEKFPMPETSGPQEVALDHFILFEAGETVELLIPLPADHPWMCKAAEDGHMRFVIPRSAVHIFNQPPVNGQMQVSIGPYELTLLMPASTKVEDGYRHVIGQTLTACPWLTPSEVVLEHLEAIHNSLEIPDVEAFWVIKDHYALSVPVGDILLSFGYTKETGRKWKHEKATSVDRQFWFRNGKQWSDEPGTDHTLVIPRKAVRVVRENGYSYPKIIVAGHRVCLNTSGGTRILERDGKTIHFWMAWIQGDASTTVNIPFAVLNDVAALALEPKGQNWFFRATSPGDEPETFKNYDTPEDAREAMNRLQAKGYTDFSGPFLS